MAVLRARGPAVASLMFVCVRSCRDNSVRVCSMLDRGTHNRVPSTPIITMQSCLHNLALHVWGAVCPLPIRYQCHTALTLSKKHTGHTRRCQRVTVDLEWAYIHPLACFQLPLISDESAPLDAVLTSTAFVRSLIAATVHRLLAVQRNCAQLSATMTETHTTFCEHQEVIPENLNRLHDWQITAPQQY